MREMLQHTPGKVFLLVLLGSIVGMLAAILSGVMERTVLVLGFITMPLLAGILFVLIWLVAYLVYFFKFWPFR
jgi:hypothetical protein